MDSGTLIKRLKRDGWKLDRVRGSHHAFVHPARSAVVTVPHPHKDLAVGTLRNIYRQARWPWKGRG